MANIDIVNKTFCCEICNLYLLNKETHVAHLAGQKHAKAIARRSHQLKEEEKANLGIFVTGFSVPANVQQLINYFQQFGNIIRFFAKNSFMIIDFSDPSCVGNILRRSHFFNGRRLTVNKKRPTNIQSQIITVDNDPNEFINLLKNVKEVEEQLKIMESNLQPSEKKETDQYDKVCADIKQALKYHYPKCEIHPFGSTVSGLNFKRSDIDVYVANMLTNTEKEVAPLYKAKRSLIHSKNFANVMVIPQAKIPILKCLHIKTKINIDVNCKTMLGVCNSQLIKYYVNIKVEKLKPLFMILKYWGKTHKLTGSNHLITNYSLSLLIIFYLQHPPFSLPSVFDLQEGNENIVDGWNASFKPLVHQNDVLETITVVKLLEGFYTFYKKFPYNSDIICPFLGKHINRSLLAVESTIPEELQRYKLNVFTKSYPCIKNDTPICLQDPLELNRNNLAVITPVTLGTFVSFCNIGEGLCQNSSDDFLLYKLFTIVPSCHKVAASSEEAGEFSIQKAPISLYLNKLLNGDGDQDKMLEEAWFDTVINFMKIVFHDFLYINIEEQSNPQNEGKVIKRETQTDVHDHNVKRKIEFNCATPYDMWNSRNAVGKNANTKQNATIIEKETTITKSMLKIYKDLPTNINNICFKMIVSCRSDPSSVTFQLQKTYSKKKSFKSFSNFIVAKFPVWFSNHENDLNQNK